MDYELLLSAEAEQCIEDQLRWYEAEETNGGAELADRWLDRLETALETLRQHPERFGCAPENGRWLPALIIRQMRFKPWKTPSAWRILYVIDEKSARVTVLQIRHENRPLLTKGGHRRDE
jgi:plasmid stabilization system protein ParE